MRDEELEMRRLLPITAVLALTCATAPASWAQAGEAHATASMQQRSTDLALQLQQRAFEVSLLCGGLMSAPPSRPSNDEGWLNAPLRQSDRDAPDFLDRPRNLQAWR